MSANGPAAAIVATSVDGFTAQVPFAVGMTAAVELGRVEARVPIEVRVSGYGAGASQGTMAIETSVSIEGTIQ